MIIEILSFGVFISGALAIINKYHSNAGLFIFLKTLTTFLILIISLIIFLQYGSNYSAFISAALVFSLTGDMFLTDKRFFIYGLSSFLIAHIVFTLAFSSVYGFTPRVLPIFILFLFSGTYFFYLRKCLNKYLIPMIIYSSAIIIMTWQATGLLYSDKSLPAYSVAAASVLFLFSDSVLALNKFKKHFKIADLLILSSYWIAIFVFATAGTYFR